MSWWMLGATSLLYLGASLDLWLTQGRPYMAAAILNYSLANVFLILDMGRS